MRNLLKLLPVIALLLFAAQPAGAWSPETRARMTEEAVRFMPASLRLALEGHREEIMRGAVGLLVREDQSEHLPPWSGGTLDRTIETEAAQLVEAIGRQAPFGEIVERFGRVAHFVMDAGFPPGVGRSESGGRYSHFSKFCESRKERFPLVFYGHDDADLDGGDFRAFALTVMSGADREDRMLAAAYAAAGDPPNPSAFDDRSIPFAVGSLSYSRSVTNVVRAWLAIWREAGGDLGRTPYLKFDGKNR
jgi:hypothetical protein